MKSTQTTFTTSKYNCAATGQVVFIANKVITQIQLRESVVIPSGCSNVGGPGCPVVNKKYLGTCAHHRLGGKSPS